MANIICPICGTTMKPLFYMNSLFCPNDCDKKPKASPTEVWLDRSSGGTYFQYQIVPPHTPYPKDTTRFILLGRPWGTLDIKDKDAADKESERLMSLSPDNLYNHSYYITDKEKEWRDDPDGEQIQQWVLAIKES